MIKDRGNIKWTAMMLPEHVEMLRELKQSNDYKTKPILDEHLLEEMNETIRSSMKVNKAVQVTYFKNGNFEIVTGVINHFDLLEQRLQVITSEGIIQIISKNIIDIKMAD